MTDPDDDDLATALAGLGSTPKQAHHTPREERIIAGFEDIQRFVATHGHPPRHGEDCDIFERLYAVRLNRIRAQADCHALLKALDHQRLLAAEPPASHPDADDPDADALAAALAGIGDGADGITALRHVRPAAEKRAAAEDIANRRECADFEQFRPLFEQVQRELDDGIRATRPFEVKSEIEPGRFFIVGGQKAYVAATAAEFTHRYGDRDARLRVIFDNGTESAMLKRSLQRALHKDGAGRRITEPEAGPLFAGKAGADETASGTIYVLRSRSDHPSVAANRELIHKIGVTTGSVERRIAGARHDPTFLLAEVDQVASYRLYNINPGKLEAFIHRVFAAARLELEIKDRFGNPVVPQEWFLVPLHGINEAVEKIRDCSITGCRYDPETASLVRE